MSEEQPPVKPDMRRRENNPMAGTGFPAQPKATKPPALHHLKNLTEHRQQQKGGTDGRTPLKGNQS